MPRNTPNSRVLPSAISRDDYILYFHGISTRFPVAFEIAEMAENMIIDNVCQRILLFSAIWVTVIVCIHHCLQKESQLEVTRQLYLCRGRVNADLVVVGRRTE